jgi:hypothetical protein
MTTTTHSHAKAQRALYAALTVLLLASVVFEATRHGAGYWAIALFAVAPDLPLLFGAGPGLEKGQLHPRAVGPYNLVHRCWGPVAVLALAASGVLGIGWFVGGLTWALHIALDRSLGYGLRTPDGFQRD